ncbi:MAG: GAF domain-containing protein [Betaproteobacteria bacterium]|nr:GAF domain-containing protein [Betaproteobacteria bacterium]
MTQDPVPPITPRRFLQKLVWIYLAGTSGAVGVVILLMYAGLNMSLEQWLLFFSALPAAMAVFIGPDIVLLRRDARPVMKALRILDSGQHIATRFLNDATAALLNLPFRSFLRVTFVHGPLAALAMVLVLEGFNYTLDVGFVDWQVWTMAACILFFAAPVHAIIEYFSLNRMIEPILVGLNQFRDEDDQADQLPKLIAVRLREKLLYLSLFVAAIPLVFFAGSTMVKINILFDELGVTVTSEQMLPLWIWLGGVAAVTGIAALTMSILTAADVSRAAGRLIEAMHQVAKGDLVTKLQVTTTDEYADLYAGFNKMVESLREEVQMLEITHDLAGEIEIDVLITRIMKAASKLLNADRGTLLLDDPKTGELWSRFAEGLEIREIRMPDDAGIAGAVFKTGRTVNIADAYQDARFNPAVDRATGYRTTSILAVPVVGKKGQRIGVVEVLNKEGGPFSAKDEIRLKAFAAEIGISLDNSRLFDEVRQVSNYNESILKSVANAIITLNENGFVASVNEAARELLQLEEGSLVGKSICPTIEGSLGNQNPWIIEALVRARDSGNRQINIDHTLNWFGIEKSVNSVATPLIGLDGEPIGNMLVLEDITAEKRVKTTMARYMSQEVADQLLAGGEDQLGGKDQDIAILFSDIRSFTTLSEALGARGTVNMLNSYFAEMVDVIFRHKGILDKYIGDAIMALFGAPFQAEDDADRAVLTAQGMLIELDKLNARRAEEGLMAIHIGVGIAMGRVIVGNIGSPKRMEYTVIGDSVNLASRLEGATKYYGAGILISEALAKRLRTPILMRETDQLRVKGKLEPVTIYEVAGYMQGAARAAFQDSIGDHEAGLAAYRSQQWDRAEQAFRAVLARRGKDVTAELYLERIVTLRDRPPPADWDGVWTMTEK